MVTTSEAREPDVYRDCSNRLSNGNDRPSTRLSSFVEVARFAFGRTRLLVAVGFETLEDADRRSHNVNLVGTHFGGSLYSMVDPHLMILLSQRLGPDYVVWDKEANIDFRKPGRGTVHATIRITDEEVEAIRSATANGDKHLPQWTLAILNERDEVVATVLKTLYVRRKREG